MALAEAKTGNPNLMASTWTSAALVRRAFNAGPRRKSDREFEDIEEAVLEAYASFRELRKRMRDAALPPRDVRAALAFMTAVYEGRPLNAGVVRLHAIPDTLSALPDLLKAAEKETKHGAMALLGVVFWQRDSDPRTKSSKTAWVQSWRVDPRIQRAADAARDAFRESDGRIPVDGLSETFEEL